MNPCGTCYRRKLIIGPGKVKPNGGSILVHVGTNNAEREGTTAIVKKYRYSCSQST